MAATGQRDPDLAASTPADPNLVAPNVPQIPPPSQAIAEGSVLQEISPNSVPVNRHYNNTRNNSNDSNGSNMMINSPSHIGIWASSHLSYGNQAPASVLQADFNSSEGGNSNNYAPVAALSSDDFWNAFNQAFPLAASESASDTTGSFITPLGETASVQNEAQDVNSGNIPA